MLNDVHLPGSTDVNLYPTELANEIDALNDELAYDKVQVALYAALDKIEGRLANSRFLLGESFTEADLRLFPTIIRFDAVYTTLFKCTKKRVADYPNLQGWMKDVYQLQIGGGLGMQVKDTIDLDSARASYFKDLFPLNPSGIVPMGPNETDLGLLKPPSREASGPTFFPRPESALPAVDAALEDPRDPRLVSEPLADAPFVRPPPACGCPTPRDAAAAMQLDPTGTWPRDVFDIQEAVKCHEHVQAVAEGHSWNQPFFCSPPTNAPAQPEGADSPPVAPAQPEGADSPPVAPAQPEGADSPPVAPAQPEGADSPPLEPAQPEGADSPPVAPAQPEGADSPPVAPAQPEGADSPPLEPAQPEGADSPPVAPAQPEGADSPPVAPAQPEGADSPPVAPAQPEGADSPPLEPPQPVGADSPPLEPPRRLQEATEGTAGAGEVVGGGEGEEAEKKMEEAEKKAADAEKKAADAEKNAADAGSEVDKSLGLRRLLQEATEGTAAVAASGAGEGVRGWIHEETEKKMEEAEKKAADAEKKVADAEKKTADAENEGVGGGMGEEAEKNIEEAEQKATDAEQKAADAAKKVADAAKQVADAEKNLADVKNKVEKTLGRRRLLLDTWAAAAEEAGEEVGGGGGAEAKKKAEEAENTTVAEEAAGETGPGDTEEYGAEAATEANTTSANIVLNTIRPLTISIDEDAETVSVDAGVKVFDLLDYLGNYVTKKSPSGWTLAAFPWFVYQSVGGAVATGTHGSSLTHNSLSHQVISITMVLADGSLRTFTNATDPFLMRAVRVGVGKLGIITSLVFRIVKEQAVKRILRTIPSSQFLSLLSQAQFMMVTFIRGDVADPALRHDVLATYEPENTTVYNTTKELLKDADYLHQLPLLDNTNFDPVSGLSEMSEVGHVERVVMGLDKYASEACVKYLNGTVLDERAIRVDHDWGFVEGRQWGRGKSGGQVRDEFRIDYDPGRGGFGKVVQKEIIHQQATPRNEYASPSLESEPKRRRLDTAGGAGARNTRMRQPQEENPRFRGDESDEEK
eukprot:gene7-12815_t